MWTMAQRGYYGNSQQWYTYLYIHTQAAIQVSGQLTAAQEGYSWQEISIVPHSPAVLSHLKCGNLWAMLDRPKLQKTTKHHQTPESSTHLLDTRLQAATSTLTSKMPLLDAKMHKHSALCAHLLPPPFIASFPSSPLLPRSSFSPAWVSSFPTSIQPHWALR